MQREGGIQPGVAFVRPEPGAWTGSLNRSDGWLAGLVIGVLLLAYQFTLPVKIDIGAPGDEPFLRGFSFAEQQDTTTYRWTGPQGEITFADVGDRPWRLSVRASGMHPTGPLPVQISVNGHPPTTQSWGGEMADHPLLIPRDQVGIGGDVTVAISTAPFVAPPDQRQLGVMVDSATLEPVGWAFTMPPWLVLVVALAVVLVGNRALDRLTGSRRAGRLAGLLLLAGFVASVVGARLQLGVYLPWLLLGAGLLWLISVRARQATWWEWLLIAAVTVLAVRFIGRALAFYHSDLPPGDFMIYFDAAKHLRTGAPLYDFAAAKGVPLGPVYKYPPLFAILLAPFTHFSPRAVAGGWFLLSLSLLMLSGYGVWRSQPAPQKPTILGLYLGALVLLAFQPAWESLIRGQMDSLIIALVVGALVLLPTRRADWLAGILLALAAMLKIYPGLLVLYLLLRRRRLALAGFAAATLAFLLLSVAVVGWETLWRYASEILTVQTAAVPWPENQSFDGFLSRLVIPAAATTWLTSDPFPSWTKLTFYLADLVALGLTLGLLWLGRRQDTRRFRLAYAAAMPLIILMWPIAWIHYQTLLLLPFWLLLLDQLRPQQRSWPIVCWLLVSFSLTAFGNEYTTLLPALEQGWPRLLQSYQLYGVVILWLLLIWTGRRPALPE